METSHSALTEVITSRKKRESGVRAVLKGKHVVTADDVFEEVVKAEEAARKRRTRKPRKRARRSISIHSEEELHSDDNIESQDGEIPDCIVVESYIS